MLGFLNKLFDNNAKDVQRLTKDVVVKVNALEAQAVNTPDLALAFAKLRERVQGGESLDAVLPEAFAFTREAAIRTLGKRHYDVQMIGGAALHQARIAEMKTGEGKTLVATLALALNALEGKGCHLVTTNDYLAKVGAEQANDAVARLAQGALPLNAKLCGPVSVHLHNQTFHQHLCAPAIESVNDGTQLPVLRLGGGDDERIGGGIGLNLAAGG